MNNWSRGDRWGKRNKMEGRRSSSTPEDCFQFLAQRLFFVDFVTPAMSILFSSKICFRPTTVKKRYLDRKRNERSVRKKKSQKEWQGRARNPFRPFFFAVGFFSLSAQTYSWACFVRKKKSSVPCTQGTSWPRKRKKKGLRYTKTRAWIEKKECLLSFFLPSCNVLVPRLRKKRWTLRVIIICHSSMLHK